MSFDTRIWAVSVLAALLAYITISLSFSGEINLVELGGFIAGFAVFWIIVRYAQEKLTE